MKNMDIARNTDTATKILKLIERPDGSHTSGLSYNKPFLFEYLSSPFIPEQQIEM